MEVQKFDPGTLMQGVKDRIKSTFVSLIPDDQWEVMVKKEIDSFFDPATKYSKKVGVINSGNGWNSYQERALTVEGDTSVFRSLVFELCFEKAIQMLKSEISDKYFKEAYDQEKMDEGLKKIIAEAIPAATNRFFESMAFGYVNRLRDDIQNHRL